ncbi:M16 family metallopeptidase [Taibaiella koreensis]|uniref:M16 family metallopeptidase n=1 Tax=Taibaiella koreensis TaxID=1268548 RepID=UPI000E59D6A1|nr:pitrilysin family protein [Taibaiella koreensis]
MSIRSLFTLSLTGLCSASLMAQRPANFFPAKLDNGLEILVVEDHSVPLVTVEITTRNGSYTESPEYNGLSHLYEHMFFKANKDYPSQEQYMARVRELGISFNGTTSDERVNYFFTLPKTNLDAGLSFMNSAIRYPLFLAEEIKKENVVVDGEFQRNESNPFFPLIDAMAHSLWGDLYSRKNTIGDHAIINSATPEKMKTIKDKYYWPNNSMLIVSGDVQQEEVIAKAKATFSDWKASGFDPFERWPIPEFKPLAKKDYFITESPIAPVPMMIFSWHGPDTRTARYDTHVADVFSYVLSQNASQFQKSLIDNGLALQANVGYSTLKYTGPITVQVVPTPGKEAECLAEVKKQIGLWDTDGYITDEQLETAKRKLEISTLQERDITTNLSHTIAYWWCSADLDYMYNYVPTLKKVSKDDIKAYVRKYIKDKNYSAGLLINPKDKDRIQPAGFWKS